jgi:hypothetical protein
MNQQKTNDNKKIKAKRYFFLYLSLTLRFLINISLINRNKFSKIDIYIYLKKYNLNI